MLMQELMPDGWVEPPIATQTSPNQNHLVGTMSSSNTGRGNSNTAAAAAATAGDSSCGSSDHATSSSSSLSHEMDQNRPHQVCKYIQ